MPLMTEVKAIMSKRMAKLSFVDEAKIYIKTVSFLYCSAGKSSVITSVEVGYYCPFALVECFFLKNQMI